MVSYRKGFALVEFPTMKRRLCDQVEKREKTKRKKSQAEEEQSQSEEEEEEERETSQSQRRLVVLFDDRIIGNFSLIWKSAIAEEISSAFQE